ncbi:MAG: CDP-alcohol phosphatidyltransferase family protein [Candidatus Zixiibacteriota bacterium]
MLSKLLQIPNLISLSRILLIPFIAYSLAQGDSRSTLISVILVIIAGITDGLDGYLARRLNQVSQFGIALDPIVDKIFAGVLVILLIFYREFPLWLAGMIVGRDLLILIAGLFLLQGRKIVLPSNITGKYTFTVIAFLLGSYIIRFNFGIELMTYLTVSLLIVSTASYYRVFLLIKKGGLVPVFKDRQIYRILRIGISIIILGLFTYKLMIEFFINI